jgi:hypothetical protein
MKRSAHRRLVKIDPGRDFHRETTPRHFCCAREQRVKTRRVALCSANALATRSTRRIGEDRVVPD